jgi:hypothetical protein
MARGLRVRLEPRRHIHGVADARVGSGLDSMTSQREPAGIEVLRYFTRRKAADRSRRIRLSPGFAGLAAYR